MSSFWSNLRWRLGTSEGMINRINDLISKQVDANSDANDVTIEEILHPIVTLPSKMVMRDHLFQSKLRTIAQGQNTILPIDPDLETLRLWIHNEHGGRYLRDHSLMNNKVQLSGTDQTKLIFANDDDGISGTPIVNRLVDDQYVRVEDNPNVQITNISQTEEGFSIFMRLYIEYARSEIKHGKANVLFSKIDSEQVDYGYAAYLEDDGALQFYVRDAGREYYLRAPDGSVVWVNINLPDYSETNYSPADYNTISTIPPIPNPAPYVDLCFTFTFADKRMQIMKAQIDEANPPIVLADSIDVISGGANTKQSTNLKGYWRMVAGGPIGDTPVNTIYDLSPNELNGLAVNPVWIDVENTLSLTGNSSYVDIISNVGGKEINTLTTAFTFAIWAKITATQNGYAGLVSNINGQADGNKILVRNNGADTEILWRGHDGVDPVDSLATITGVNLVNDGLWHHYAVTYDAVNVVIYLDGAPVFTEEQTYTLGSGSTGMTLGWGSTTAGDFHLTGLIKDAMLWDINMTDQEILALYEQDNTFSYFPKWRADPPTEPPPPSPSTNPFALVYNAPPPIAAEQDFVRLHAITAAALNEHYNVGQGTQQTSQNITEDGSFYSNDIPYTPGSTPETQSNYNIGLVDTVAINSYLRLDSTQFGGERFTTGSDVIGKTISRIQACFADVNFDVAPASGDIVCKIKKASGGSPGTDIVSPSSVDAGNFPPNQGGADDFNWANHQFDFPGNTYLMQANDRIQFEFDEGGTGGGGVGETITGYANRTATVATYDNAMAGFSVGQHVRSTSSALYNKVISKIVVKMNDASSAGGSTGAIQAFITNSSQSTTYASSDTKQAQDLPNQPGSMDVTFTFTNNTHAMVVNDIIIIKHNYNGSGTTTAVGVAVSADTESGSEEGTYFLNFPGPGWFGFTTPQDICMDVYEGGTGGGGGGGGTTTVYDCASAANDTYAQFEVTGYNVARQVIRSTSSPMYGKIIRQISFFLGRNNVTIPPGFTVKIGIGTSTGSFQTFQTLNASSIPVVSSPPSGLTQFTTPINTTNTYVMGVNDYIWVGADGPMEDSPAQHVYCRASASSKVADSNIYLVGNVPDADFPSNDVVGSATGDTPGGGGGGGTGGAMQIGLARVACPGGDGAASPCEAFAVQFDGQWANPGTLTDRTTHDVSMKVWLGGTTGTPSHIYNKLNIAASQNRIAAIFINSASHGLVGKKPTKVTCRMYKVGTPTGTIFCRIKKGSDGSTITFGLNGLAGAGLLASDLSQTVNNPAILRTFENDDNGQEAGYALQVGDRIIFELVGGSSDATTNYVQIAKSHTSSTIPNAFMQMSTNGTTWTPSTANQDDVIGIVYVGGFTIPTINPSHKLGFENTRVAQRITSTIDNNNNLYSRKITQVKPWLARVGLTTGTISVVIRGSDNSIKATIGNMQAIDVSDIDFTQYTFTNLANTHPMAVGDRISIEYSGGDANKHILVNTNLLNSYPYGELDLFSGSTWSSRIGHDLAGAISSGGGATDPLARTRVGEKVATTSSAIKLKKISRVKVWLKKTGDADGNVSVLIRNAADQIAATIGSVPAVSITSDPTEYTITSSPIAVYPLAVGDRVTVEYSAGNDFKFIEVMTSKTTDAFDGTTHTYLDKYDGANWVVNNAIDLIGQMYEGGDTFTPSQEDVTIPDPVYTKDLCILAGGYPWTYINHVTSTLTHAPSQLFTNAVMPDFRFYRKILTLAEVTNIFVNRSDRADIPFGEVAKLGFFVMTET